MNKRISQTRRLYVKVCELGEKMHRLVAHDGSPEAVEKLSRVERRFWPLETELLRRMDERDELRVEVDRLLKPSPIVADRIQRELETHFASPVDLAHYVVDLLTIRDKRIAKLATDLSVKGEQIARLTAEVAALQPAAEAWNALEAWRIHDGRDRAELVKLYKHRNDTATRAREAQR